MDGKRRIMTSPKRGRSRGIVLLVTMVCIGIAGTMLVSVLRGVIIQRGALRTELHRVQAAWLAESGVERAAWRLAADPDYPGETWNPPAESLPGGFHATVSIQVEPSDERSDQRVVHVQADYPDDPKHRVRFSKQVTIQTRPSPEGER